MNKKTMRMFDLQPGDLAVVRDFSTTSQETARLRDLGLVEGTRFRVIRYAPLGDPIEIKLRGFYLSIGRATADAISVQNV